MEFGERILVLGGGRVVGHQGYLRQSVHRTA